MSFLLLRYPDRKREIYDDLESAFWVLTYYALRFVKHNKSLHQDLVSRLFDEARQGVDAHGEPCLFGGLEKRLLISMDTSTPWAGLKFDSEPFTELFKELRLLFVGFLNGRNLANSHDESVRNFPWYVQCREELQSPKRILELFQKALDRDDWPADDKVPDQIVPRKPMCEESDGDSRSTVASSSSSHLKRSSRSSQNSPLNKRLKNSLEL